MYVIKKILNVSILTLGIVVSGFMMPIDIVAHSVPTAIAAPIEGPLRDTLGNPIISPYQTEHRYAARVNDGLFGFLILIIVAGVGLWLIKIITKREIEEQEATQE